MSQNIESVANEITVKLDVSDLQKMLVELYEKQFSELKEFLKPKTDVTIGPSPIDQGRAAFVEWLTKIKNEIATEAVTGIPSTFTYRRQVLLAPHRIGVGLRDYADVIRVREGENEARWYKSDVPAFSTLTSRAEAPEVTHTITTATATLVERGARQVVGYEELEKSVIDLVATIEKTFDVAAENDVDKMILDELDTNTNVHYAGGKSSESALAASDKLTLAELLEAKRKLVANAKRIPRPGELVLVCSVKQYHDLLSDPNVIKAAEFGSDQAVRRGEVSQVLGINILATDLVSTGAGAAGVTTYRAHLFFPGSFGLAVARDLTIEAFREPPRRAISFTASYRAGAKLIEPAYAIKVITA